MSNNVNPTRVVTGEVRLSYANVFEAKSINGGKPKYSVSLIIPKSDKATLAKIERAIDAGKETGPNRLEITDLYTTLRPLTSRSGICSTKCSVSLDTK